LFFKQNQEYNTAEHDRQEWGMSRVRIYELAKEAGMGSKALAERLIEQGYDIKGHSSTVDEETAAKIRSSVLQSSDSKLVEKRIDAESGGATVIRRRATIIRRPKKVLDEEPQEEKEILVDLVDHPEEKSIEEVQAPVEPIVALEKEKVVEQTPVEKEPVAEEMVEKQPQTEETVEEPEQKKETFVKTLITPVQDKPLRKGVARVIGTIEIPVEAPRSTPVRKKASRPSASPGRPAQPRAEQKESVVPGEVQPVRAKKKGKRPVEVETETPKKAGWKSAKKDRKNMRVTRFGDDYDSYTKRGKRGKGKAKKSIQPAAEMKAIKKRIKVADTISVGDLAHRMRIKANEIIAKLMGLGVMATLNQALDVDTATLVAADFGYEVEQGFTEEIGVQQLIEQEEGGEEVFRPPVVTVMGHVDHGKTSILDAIRHTDVADGEAGGITQHIGAYHVSSKAGDVTFVDTPGHAAFTEMRSRGAQITDIVILVVAADDGVMDQTREAIHHAQAAEVPILVVVNKIDKANADPDRVKRELAELNLSPEEWGGDTIYCETSAKKNIGIDKLMENIELMAEMLELKADPNRKARGRVIEAKLDKGRGAVATILVQEGTLKTGDYFVVGQFSGKVRALLDYRGKPVKSAKPSIPVEVQGLNGVPSAGDEFVVVTDEKMAKSVSQVRALKARESELASNTKVSLDKLFEKLSEGEVQELRVVLRADVQGTLEAFGNAAEKLSTDEVKVRVLHEGTGTITESDILLASASDAVIIGFNVRPTSKVKELASKENVDVRSYDVIYHALDDIRKAMVGLLEPTFEEEVIGSAEVRDIFRAPKVGTIAGCFVTDGKMQRNASLRVLREGVVVYTGKVGSLRRFKDDTKEVLSGYECGITIENFNDIKLGDIMEAFVLKEVAGTLGATQQEKEDGGEK